MAVKDRPLFRRILEFDDLLRRRRVANTTTLAARRKASTKTVQRFVAFMRDEMEAPIVYDRRRRSFRYADPNWHLPWIPVEGPGVVKTFYVSRIRDAEGTAETFSIPRDFELKRHFGETIGIFAGGAPFRFRVLFTKAMAAWVAEVRWHPKQQLTTLPSGDLELELPAGSLFEARRFVLSFWKEATALEPVELVESLREETESMAASYRAARR